MECESCAAVPGAHPTIKSTSSPYLGILHSKYRLSNNWSVELRFGLFKVKRSNVREGHNVT